MYEHSDLVDKTFPKPGTNQMSVTNMPNIPNFREKEGFSDLTPGRGATQQISPPEYRTPEERDDRLY